MTASLIERRTREAITRGHAVAPLLLVALLLGAIFLQWAPHHFQAFQAFDSGIFLYVAQQLREGAHLYRNVWDHKPPLIFVFNTLGLYLGGDSPGGVWLLDYLGCLVFFSVACRELQRLFGASVAFLATSFGLLAFHDLTPQPNLGEVVSLPFQIAAFLLLVRDFERGVSLIRACWQAVFFALLFWTRPNGAAISLIYCAATVIMLLRQQRLSMLLKWALVVAGVFAASSLLLAAPFAAASSWRDVWFATFTFNRIYADLATTGQRLRALWWMMQYASTHGVLLLAEAGMLSIVFRRRLSPVLSKILLSASAWLVLEFVFAAYTGKQYGKNLIPALMPMMIAMGTFFHFVTENASDSRGARLTLHIASAVVACFTLALSASQFRENAKVAPGSAMLLVPEVQRLTSPSECAAFWGIFRPEVIFASHRPACTRFFSSIPLAHAETTYRLLAPLALDDLERSRPKLIVQHDDGQVPSLTGQTKDMRGPSRGWDTPELIERKRRLMQAYRLAWSGPEGLTVIYERR